MRLYCNNQRAVSKLWHKEPQLQQFVGLLRKPGERFGPIKRMEPIPWCYRVDGFGGNFGEWFTLLADAADWCRVTWPGGSIKPPEWLTFPRFALLRQEWPQCLATLALAAVDRPKAWLAISDCFERIDWNSVDWLAMYPGAWRLEEAGLSLIRRAKIQGKRVHFGPVAAHQVTRVAELGCHSAELHLRFGLDSYPTLLAATEQLAAWQAERDRQGFLFEELRKKT